MPVIHHDYQKSDGLEKELAHIKNDFQHAIQSCKDMSVQEFIDNYFKWKTGMELANTVALLDPGSSVLDIGAGFGQSSVYLALHGHTVTAIEPSPEACACIEAMAIKADRKIEIHACAMENFDTYHRFDACIFNASLHHCDDPETALKKCRSFLKPGGRVFLINEQVLKFYRSKKWWRSMLEKKPDNVAHYGGNEHNYRYGEYISMLKSAGFAVNEKVPVYYTDPRAVLSSFLPAKLGNGKYVYSALQVFVRYIWYSITARLIGNALFFGVCKKLSLISTTMIGKKTP
jgi:2-polyprenyl-3-methyl-5-hydroxy-6-metoxy-1,4-benzoquinol methylase